MCFICQHLEDVDIGTLDSRLSTRHNNWKKAWILRLVTMISKPHLKLSFLKISPWLNQSLQKLKWSSWKDLYRTSSHKWMQNKISITSYVSGNVKHFVIGSSYLGNSLPGDPLTLRSAWPTLIPSRSPKTTLTLFCSRWRWMSNGKLNVFSVSFWGRLWS